MMEPWAKRVRALLDEGIERGLSDSGLAKACRISQPALWQWFKPPKGRKTTKDIMATNAVRAAKYLGTTVEYLFTGTGQRLVSQPVGLDVSMLQSAIVTVRKSLIAFGLEMDSFIVAPFIAYAYRERLKHPREMTAAEYADFDAAIAQRLRGELGHERQEGSVTGGSKKGINKTTPDWKAIGDRRE